MITEDFVSFETAKLLKEKGFDEKCSKFWLYNKNDTNEVCLVSCGLLGDTNLELNNSQIDTILNDNKNGYSAPTLQMAMKWLREVHKLFIQICIIPHTTITIEQKYYLFTIHKDRRTLAFRKDFPSEYYFTYEEACETAIKYCLENLI